MTTDEMTARREAIGRVLQFALNDLVKSGGMPGAVLVAILPDGSTAIVASLDDRLDVTPLDVLELAADMVRTDRDPEAAPFRECNG